LYEVVRNRIRAILRVAGYDFVRSSRMTTAASRRARMIRYHAIQTVVDVGANIGEYGAELREWGFQGRILSIEPTSAAFGALSERASGDARWTVLRFAAGAENGVAKINVASNAGASSSLIPMLDSHRKSAPEVKFVASEQVEIRTLDTALADLIVPGESLMLKIDTQGFEQMVLRGATATLTQVRLIECELSFVPLYEGQLIFHRMLELLDSLGFYVVQFAPGFPDPESGHCLQVDGIFARKQ